MSNNAIRTKVSKSHRAVKALLNVTFPTWTGRKVVVIEAGSEWTHTQYVDDLTRAMVVDLATCTAVEARRPTYGGAPVVHRALAGCAVVMLSRFMGQDMGIEIIVPMGALAADALTVATDAALEGKRGPAASVCAECGDYAGIAHALVEARVKNLSKPSAAVHA